MRALRAARQRYELAHLRAAVASALLAFVALAFVWAVHGLTREACLFGGLLVVSMAVLAWGGGGWRRGAHFGLVVGLLVLALSLVMSRGQDLWPSRDGAPVSMAWAVGAAAGIAIMRCRHRSSLVFAVTALPIAALAGLLGYRAVGPSRAVGLVVGIVIGAGLGVISGRAARDA